MIKNRMYNKEIQKQADILIKTGYPPLFARGRSQQIIANQRRRENRMKNPWLRPAPDYYQVNKIEATTVEDRIDELKRFDSSKLIAVIDWPGTQKTVRSRAKTLLRKRGIKRRNINELSKGIRMETW